jgi:CBS domain containing-hemolysin-like protein
LLLLSALFSSAETAVFSLTKLQIQRLREENSRVSRALVRFLDDPRQLLITTLVGNNLVNTAFATLVVSLMLRVSASTFGWDVGATLTVSMLTSTLLLLLCGEITPKTSALRHADRLARWVAVPLTAAAWTLTPVRVVIRLFVDAVGRLFGVRDLTHSELVTKEEFRRTVNDGEATGVLGEHERDFIHRIVELREMSARDIMVPRTEMVCVEGSVTLESALDTARRVGHSRIPVYEGNVDNIVFVLHVKDYPKWHHLGVLEHSLRDIYERRTDVLNGSNETLLRKPLFLPETKRLNALLRDFAVESTQMAILLDEYGGTAGLITLEDIVEEITGEIVDEYDALLEPELAENLSPDALRREGMALPAKLSLRTAARLLRTPFDTEIADTVGGYVFSLFDRVPSVGESVEDANRLSFQIVAMTGTRIQKVLVRKLVTDASESEPETEP